MKKKPPYTESISSERPTVEVKYGHSRSDSYGIINASTLPDEHGSEVPESVAMLDTHYLFHRSPERFSVGVPDSQGTSPLTGHSWDHDAWSVMPGSYDGQVCARNNIPRCSPIRARAYGGGPRGGVLQIQFETGDFVGLPESWKADADPAKLHDLEPRVADCLRPLDIPEISVEGIETRIDLPTNILVHYEVELAEYLAAFVDLRRSLGLLNAYASRGAIVPKYQGSVGITNTSRTWTLAVYTPDAGKRGDGGPFILRVEIRFRAGRDIEKFQEADTPRTLPGVIYGFRFLEAVIWFIETRLGLYPLAPPDRTDDELIAESKHGITVKRRLMALLPIVHRRGVASLRRKPPKWLGYCFDADGRSKKLDRDLGYLRKLGISIHSRRRGELYRIREAILAAWATFEARRPPQEHRPPPPPGADLWFQKWRREISDGKYARKLWEAASRGEMPMWLTITPKKFKRLFWDGNQLRPSSVRPFQWSDDEVRFRFEVVSHIYRWRWTPSRPPLFSVDWAFKIDGLSAVEDGSELSNLYWLQVYFTCLPDFYYSTGKLRMKGDLNHEASIR